MFILIILFWICTHKILYQVFLDISCTGTKINSKVSGHHFKGLEGLGRKSYITNGAISSAELQKDYFCPVSWFSNEKCPNYVFGEIYHNRRHKGKHRLVFCSFKFIWNWILSEINTILSFLGQDTKIDSNYLKMSGFSFRNVRYPRFLDQWGKYGLLQTWSF